MSGEHPFGINYHLPVEVYRDADAASAAGYDYNKWLSAPKPLRIEKAVIVRKGTVDGNSTVDFIFVDAEGNHYVTCITGNLLKVLPL